MPTEEKRRFQSRVMLVLCLCALVALVVLCVWIVPAICFYARDFEIEIPSSFIRMIDLSNFMTYSPITSYALSAILASALVYKEFTLVDIDTRFNINLVVLLLLGCLTLVCYTLTVIGYYGIMHPVRHYNS